MNDPARRLAPDERRAWRQAILQALELGPLPKWELALKLRVSEQVLYLLLRELRATHVVKKLGRNSRDVRWALAGWTEPPSRPRAQTLRASIGEDNTVMVHKRAASVVRQSWWTQAPYQQDRAAFYANVHAQEDARIHPRRCR